MKRLSIIIALAACLSAVSCVKPINPDLPTITWAENSNFSQVELMPGMDANVVLTAPGKIESLILTLGLGNYGLLANPYIKVGDNKGKVGDKGNSSKYPVFDVIDDPGVASFLSGLGMTAGAGLRGKTLGALDLAAIITTLIEGQPVENNTVFSVDVKLTDQAGNIVSKVAKFHYTSGPSITWDGNPEFNMIDLNDSQKAVKVSVTAPGRFDKFTVELEYGAAPELANYVKNRTTDGRLVIDLIGDAKVVDSFKDYLPAGSIVNGKTSAVLDFSFMYGLKYDISSSVNVFTIYVADKNGKEASAQVKFKK